MIFSVVLPSRNPVIQNMLNANLTTAMKALQNQIACFSTGLLAAAACLLGPGNALGQTVTITSVSPTNGATGVATSAPLVFTFSTAMYTSITEAIFTNGNTLMIPQPSGVWSGGGTVLTYTSAGGWPANSTLLWSMIGFSASFQPLTGTVNGSFSTGSGGGSTSVGTNQSTLYSLISGDYYQQTSTGAPALNTNTAYLFLAEASVTSNRNVTNATVTLPGGSISNLNSFVSGNNYSLVYGTTNLATITNLFPSGNYVFNVTGPASNTTVTVVMSNTTIMPMPNSPHVNNYTAAQAVNATNNFTLSWDALSGGTSADYISVDIQPLNLDTDLWRTPVYGVAGALNGTATSAVIPANTLLPGSNYTVNLQFTRINVSSNSAYGTSIDRTALTVFNLATIGGSAGSLMLTNATYASGSFSFDVSCTAGQTFTLLSATNPAAASNAWQSLLTTNPAGSKVHYTDSRAATNKMLFYRGRNGS